MGEGAREKRGVCHADHKLLQLRCSSCAKPCFRAGGSHTNTTSQTSAAAGTPGRTYCPQNLINHCFISKGSLRSVVVQLHFGCTSASSESGEWNTGLSPSPELLSEPSPRGQHPRPAAGERCPGRRCPPEGGRGSARRFARLERGRQPAPLPNTSRYPGGRRRPGRGPGGAQPAPSRRCFPRGWQRDSSPRASPWGFCACLGRGPGRSSPEAVGAQPCGSILPGTGGATDAPRGCGGQSEEAGGDPLHPLFSLPRGSATGGARAAAASPASRGGGRARRCPGPFPAAPLPVRKKASTSESGTAPSSAAPSAGFMAGEEAAASPAAGNIQWVREEESRERERKKEGGRRGGREGWRRVQLRAQPSAVRIIPSAVPAGRLPRGWAALPPGCAGRCGRGGVPVPSPAAAGPLPSTRYCSDLLRSAPLPPPPPLPLAALTARPGPRRPPPPLPCRHFLSQARRRPGRLRRPPPPGQPRCGARPLRAGRAGHRCGHGRPAGLRREFLFYSLPL